MEGYAAESVAANRKILRKRSFRNIEKKVPKAKKKSWKDTEKERAQSLRMEKIGKRKDIRVAIIVVGLSLLGISGIVYLLSDWWI